MRVGILGNKQSILAFRALGLETFSAGSVSEIEKAKEITSSNDFAILFITEETAQQFKKEIAPFFERTSPAVLVVPGLGDEMGEGEKSLKMILERALGSDILA